ncbi:MAG: RNA polymerase sigma factor [Saprospiraceae bacterium]|nr:RNA polymerase sigma factor [Saprospiraceae bacterium]
MTEHELDQVIQRCRKEDALAQKMLYMHFYNYAMTICYRYTQNREEAQEVLNDGFFKAFKNLHRYESKGAFKFWLKKILVNTAIDHFRKHKNAPMVIDLVTAGNPGFEPGVLANLEAEELFNLVKRLPTSYRIAFNLHAVEGYSHPEIAEMLGISEGTSKSNLAKARQRLKAIIAKNYGLKKYG